ncbi:MAG: hypothetical protein JWP42_1726 [Pseudomonas sp.]|nr:hypothetical protein [Pseudomonas sp.]
MGASLSGVFNLQEFTDLGALAVGYRLYTYAAGTTTLKVAYTDAAGLIPHTYTSDGIGGQYVALNARGELPAGLFLAAGGYDLALKTAAGATVWTRRASGGDNSSDTLRADLASTDSGKGATLVSRLGGGTVQDTITALGAANAGAGAGLNYNAETLDLLLQYLLGSRRQFARGLPRKAASALILGDSIWGSGIGVTAPADGIPTMICRSIMNAMDDGEDESFGHLYHTQLNAYPNGGSGTWVEQGVSVGGGVTPLAGTLTNYRFSVPAGGWIEITGRNMSSADVFYDAGASTTGVMTVALNSTAVTTRAITAGSGISTTYTIGGAPAWLRPGEGNVSTNRSDIVRLTFSQPCVIQGLVTPQRAPVLSPFVFLAGREGAALDNFQTSALWDEMAAYLNFNDFTGVNGAKLCLIGLGANDIYFRRYSPAQMVTYLNALIGGINARCSNVTFLYVVPTNVDPARAATLGITMPTAYPVADYVDALEAYCLANKIAIHRADQISQNPAEFTDGLHLDGANQRRQACEICNLLNIPFDPSLVAVDLDPSYDRSKPIQFAPAFNSTWRSYAGIAGNAPGARRRAGRIDLFGWAEPNGSVSTTVMTLPAGCRPIGRQVDLRAMTATTGTLVDLSISTAGVVTISALPAGNILKLDGLGFEISVTTANF